MILITLSLTNGNSIIVSIPKKGNSSSLENQRCIAKSCAIAKLRNKLLLARIRDIIESQLLGVQSGIHAGRSTVEQTMALRYILDMCRVSKPMTTIIFLDFNKAFESICRHAIPMVLSMYGISELLIANVMQFYIWMSAVVAIALRNTEKISATSGVHQGSTLAPCLFITLLDYVLRETLFDNIDGFTITPRRSSRGGGSVDPIPCVRSHRISDPRSGPAQLLPPHVKQRSHPHGVRPQIPDR